MIPQPTNATKAIIATLANALFGLLLVFDVPLSDPQQGAIIGFVNAAFAAYVALTFKDSPKRLPEDTEARPEALR